MTHIEEEDLDADVYFPEISEDKWRKIVIVNDEDNNIKFSFVEYIRV
jgi:hypothetical protein